MDNRRVMKAYKERAREKVLPYPSRDGLFSKVKRYISGSSLKQQANKNEQTQNPSANTTINRTSSNMVDTVLGDVSLYAQRSASEAPIRVLSSFFHDRGDKPLSQVEYEGVMTLLEKSRADITIPEPEANSTSDQHNNTVLANKTFTLQPRAISYLQKVLRNTSMYDGNTSSFLAPDYKPIYHTFNDTSRSIGNTSVKRVYQFSGLPSPYRTRIRAPSMARKVSRRVSVASETPEVSAPPAKPISSTANSLLSILDGQHDSTTGATVSHKTLHNPYARQKRKAQTEKQVLTANDISKTVSYNKAEELPDVKKQKVEYKKEEDKKEEKLETKPESPIKQNTADVKITRAAEPKKTTEESTSTPALFAPGIFEKKMANGSAVAAFNAEKESTKAFSFGKTETAPSTKSFSFKDATKPVEAKAPISFGATQEKAAFSFGAKPTVSDLKPSDNGFKPTSNGAENGVTTSKPFSFGGAKDGINGSSSTVEAQVKPFTFGSAQTKLPVTESTEKPTLFGTSTTTKPFSFASTQQPLFGAKVDEAPVEDKKEPTPFSFGPPKVNGSKPANGFGDGPIKVNGLPSHVTSGAEFTFPTASAVSIVLDSNKLEEYKKLFEF